MSAVATARRVLEWALTGSGPLPQGDLREAGRLARPGAPLSRALGTVAAVTAARLRLFAGAGGSLSMTGTVLAAALGALHTPPLARRLVGAAAPSANPWDWLVHHGLLERALPFFTGEAAAWLDDFITVSPLTAVLHHPVQGRQGEALTFARAWLHERTTRRCLQFALAQPSHHVAVLRWRRDLLERLRLAGETERDGVLDVYEAAMIHHQPALLEQVRAARAALSTPDAGPETWQYALAVAAWWGPLAALERSHPDALRARRYLGYGYREGIALHHLAQSLSGGRP